MALHKLNKRQVNELLGPEAKPVRLSDGGGLYAQVAKKGGSSWAFRYERGGRERWMGLGPLEDVSLEVRRHSDFHGSVGEPERHRCQGDGISRTVRGKNALSKLLTAMKYDKRTTVHGLHSIRILPVLTRLAAQDLRTLSKCDVSLLHLTRNASAESAIVAVRPLQYAQKVRTA